MATKNIVPRADLEGGIGTDSKKWASGSFGRVNVSSYVSGSGASTASFGTYRGDGSQLTGITSGIFQTTGSVEATTNNLQVTGSLTVSTTGSFGRIEATAISASRVDVDAGTIAVGGQPINSKLVQNVSNVFSTTEVQSAGETTGSFGRVEANVVQANEYIVSSSVTQITTQQLSGSTQFGDSSDDTHQFTGSLL